jgi:hypothetical protein
LTVSFGAPQVSPVAGAAVIAKLSWRGSRQGRISPQY